jgi:hypothetical protein
VAHANEHSERCDCCHDPTSGAETGDETRCPDRTEQRQATAHPDPRGPDRKREDRILLTPGFPGVGGVVVDLAHRSSRERRVSLFDRTVDLDPWIKVKG